MSTGASTLFGESLPPGAFIQRCVYIGPPCGWNVCTGDTALVRPSETPGRVLAQFDDFTRQRGGKDLAFGWHDFPANHFAPSPQ